MPVREKDSDVAIQRLRLTLPFLVCFYIILSLPTHILYLRWGRWGDVVGFGPPPPLQSSEQTQKRQKKASPKLKSANLRKGDGKGNKILPKPKDWEKFNYHETRAHFDCDEYAEDLVKPLPTLKDWEYLRSKYIEIVDNHAVFDDPVPPTDGYTFDENGSPPYYASHGERGRGLFASRNIKKGEIIHDGKKSDVEFPGGETWRKFVFSLPRNRACDVIEWSWTQKKSRSGKYRLFSAMNISILFNGAEDIHNVNVKPASSVSTRFYASRDIQKGEELLYDYDVYETVWEDVGL
jgi:hypothetical protein